MVIGAGNAIPNVDTWTDLSGFSALRQQAQTNSKAALPVVAKQFESIFTQMMLKSMRDANYGDPLFDSQSGDAWQGLFDQQLSVTLAAQGRGLGIADMLVRQLGGQAAGSSTTSYSTASAASNERAKNAPKNDWHERLDSVTSIVRSAGQAASHWISANPVYANAEQFVSQLAPYALKAAAKLGVSLRAVLAQAALETHWGKHMPAHADGSSSNNLFGMKAGAGWDGGRVNVPTLEFEGGVPVRRQAQFRAYATPKASFEDFVRLVGENPRYAGALGKGDDVLGFARGLVAGSYATDPAYASKIAAIADSPVMRQALAELKNSVSLPTPTE